MHCWSPVRRAPWIVVRSPARFVMTLPLSSSSGSPPPPSRLRGKVPSCGKQRNKFANPRCVKLARSDLKITGLPLWMWKTVSDSINLERMVYTFTARSLSETYWTLSACRDARAAVKQGDCKNVEGSANVWKTKNLYQLYLFLFRNDVEIKNNTRNYRKPFWLFWVRE